MFSCYEVNGRAHVHLEDWGDGDWFITRVWTHRGYRNMGLMRKIMRQVLEDADREQVTLMLDCGDGEKFGLSSGELRAWYERLGFTSYVGRRMVRELGIGSCADEQEPEIERWDGNALCPVCGVVVYRHDMAENVLDYQGEPFVRLLCDGTLAKT